MQRDYAAMARKANEAWVANGRKPRGFAAMTPAQVRAAAKKSRISRKRKAHGAPTAPQDA